MARGKKKAGQRPVTRRLIQRARRWLLWGLAVIFCLPLVLTLAYRFLPPPITPLMVIRVMEGRGLEKDWVPWSEISPNLRRAAVAAEDNLFCEHRGFDWGSLEVAVRSYADGKRAGGGSTISMQTAKNLFLWPKRSVVRKVLEVPLTATLELLWPKQRIMEVYLNIAEWGPGIYGAEAAAQAHFGVSADKLSLRQASQLAAVLPNPLNWSAGKPGNHVTSRAATIRKRIRQLGTMLDCVTE